MNLIFRLIRVLILSLVRSRLDPLDPSVLHFRAWPFDLDINVHMTNSRYFALMDLGRTELILRNGIAKQMFKRKWQPVVSGSTMRFKRAIKPFQKFAVETHALYWDDKGFYLEQRFVANGKTLALGVVKAVFVGPEGIIRPEEICRLVGADETSPLMPDWLSGWPDMESAIEARLAA
ncbi:MULTISPECIES: acyl-CoA thioesterase [Thalassospira]|uniref:Acyl-CoA thioesterase n=4 Tax=Thalassospira TaxID=168934 RepID=A0A3D5NEH4_9PROT|nr:MULTISPECIES: acyl-CoA thioesterase [Thalassospira]PKR59045.1 thioesterase [Thalassospira lohafexi]RCK29009.1 thioesterase [Thalassospira lucentensis MCCC 1A00383 = DSM 14000]HCW69816.1 acyl-CoA thioesterase [Thalassospira lucentensis]